MKKIVYLIILSSFFSFAQTPATLKVSGRAVHIDSNPTFFGSVTLSASYSSFPAEAISLDQMKEKYNNSLKSNGLSFADLQENSLMYDVLGYEKEGTVYEFKTTSLDKFRKFGNSKSFGVQRLSYDQSIVLDLQEIEVLSKTAFKNAKEKATAMAKAMGLHLGKVLAVEDHNNHLGEELINGMHYDRPIGHYTYELFVTFSIGEN